MFKVQACSAAQTFVQAQNPWQHLKALQVDAAYGDSGMIDDNPNDDLAVVDFGLNLNVGEIGKVALAHTDNKYEVTDTDNDGDSDTSETAWETKTTAIAGEVSVSDLTACIGAQTAKKVVLGWCRVRLVKLLLLVPLILKPVLPTPSIKPRSLEFVAASLIPVSIISFSGEIRSLMTESHGCWVCTKVWAAEQACILNIHTVMVMVPMQAECGRESTSS